MVWALRWLLAALWILVLALLQFLPNFSQTTSQISTPNDSDGIQMGISSTKQCLFGPRMKNEVMQGQWFGP
jgi:hypothetical protein